MSWHVQMEPDAINQAAGLIKQHKGEAAELFAAIDSLTAGPRADLNAHAWGSDHYRIRRGPWRILYRADVDNQTIHVEHVGRRTD